METLVDYPAILFVLVLALLIAAVAFGAHYLRRLAPLSDEERENFSVIQTAILTLLALLVGFCLSMAVSRYDQRKNLEEAETNAIGTQYSRSDLIGADTGGKMKAALIAYTRLRLADYQTRDPQERARIGRATREIQTSLWQLAVQASQEKPTPIGALAVAGMNDVLNSQDFAEASRINHVPLGAWILIILIAVFACIAQGYGTKGLLRKAAFIPIFPATIALSLAFIADIDSPRGGIIHVQPQNLARLLDSFAK